MSNNTDTTALNETLFETIKNLLVENERLFAKLRATGTRYESIDFDESGLYEEEEQTALRHYDTLSRKIIQSLNDAVEMYAFNRTEHHLPDAYTLSFELSNDEISYQLHVDYRSDEALVIT